MEARDTSAIGSKSQQLFAIMQPVDQVVGPLAAAQVQIDQGDRGGLLGGRAIGLGRGGDRSGHIRAPGLEKVLQGDAEMPGVLDQEDAHTLQVPGTGSRQVMSVR